jgi:hypothetical protein
MGGKPGEVRELKSLRWNVSRQLGGWIDSLLKSTDPGPRYRTPESRRAAQESQRRDSYMAYLRQVQDEAKRKPPGPPGSGSTDG